MSQLDPLPSDLPFRIISKTIGRGAYASIKKAIPPHDTTPIFAVKFIHKAYAVKHGRISAKQIAMEVSLHSHIGQHPNIIEWFATGEDAIWKWIAMEYAEGGDLFDKIEADVGVSEDIAHFYFTQLISGVSYMHSKGVGHRDIKPENILLSDSGNLKIADFGLATLFEYQGQTKLSTTMCGSPPYIAPEVISCSKSTQSRHAPKGSGYAANLCDIWSCGVVLFVLLVGNTPWDEPTAQSWEFEEYLGKKGRSTDDLWQKLPSSVLSLLRGMMNVDPRKRFSFNHIKQHPWYTRRNPLLTADGKMTDPLSLATQMLEGLRIDFSQQPTSSQRVQRGSDAMDLDDDHTTRFSFTQPETPINDVMFDWERPPRVNATTAFSASQPTRTSDGGICTMTNGSAGHPFESLADEPSMSQFTPAPSVPLSLTQHARRFRDIVPNYSLTRFFSHLSSPLLLQMLSDALHQLNVPIPPVSQIQGREHAGWIKVKTLDGRQCSMNGDIVIDTYIAGEAELLEVRFVKVKGDPLEWRRFFKNVVVLCKDGVYVPSA
ncbi:serine/threonine-protein kinase-like protein chk1 [Mollisia scopiformis]|uniref:non-specific serine/threonine protein kinase n=1 Tax=Mollisia scopiformis TaxID=149040 RepID=A0A194XUZ5_MOLSC|nr:serine/threonine-protein kinase-like protein chk1 [Mollisia scopiformis]KUJ24145.1 serine/threonine-protein kinase-like protein chk1 [Mollisia scopiformis]